MQTRTQKFAGKAMERIKAVAPANRKEYKSRADSFPTMVLQSGLTQALGFHLGKGERYRDYVDDLAKVIGTQNGADLHTAALAAALPEYRRLTHDVLQAAALMKRYGQIHLKEARGTTEVGHAL